MRHAWLAALALGTLAPSAALAASAGQVSFLEGKATRAPKGGGAKVDLAKGGAVEAGDDVATSAGSKLELTLADGSIVRLGPDSRTHLDEAAFEDGERKFSAKVVFGSVWAKVSTALGGGSKFEVTTDRAVAGVRGTTFRVDAHKDKAVLVKVFAGAVAVAGASIPRPLAPEGKDEKGKTGRKQVAGPHQVTKQEWEKLVGAQMQIAVNSDGTPGEPQKFAEADACKDPWTAWNRDRDGEPCPK